MPVQNPSFSAVQRAQCYRNLPSRTCNGPPVSASSLGPCLALDVCVARAEILSEGRAGPYPEEFEGFGMSAQHFGALAQWLSAEHHAPDTIESIRVGCTTVCSLGLFTSESVRYQTRQRMTKICDALNREYAKTSFSFQYRPAIHGDKARIIVTARGTTEDVPGAAKKIIAAKQYRWNTVDSFEVYELASTLQQMGVPSAIAARDAVDLSNIKQRHSAPGWMIAAAGASVIIWPLGLIPALLGDKTDIDARTKKYAEFIHQARVQPTLYGVAYGLERHGNSVIFTATKLGVQNA